MTRSGSRRSIWGAVLVVAALAKGVWADDVLETSGFTSCGSDAAVTVQRVDIKYDNANKNVIFNVAGTSNLEQNVTATLNVTAYGTQIYSNSFDPCSPSTFVKQLCPGMSHAPYPKPQCSQDHHAPLTS